MSTITFLESVSWEVWTRAQISLVGVQLGHLHLSWCQLILGLHLSWFQLILGLHWVSILLFLFVTVSGTGWYGVENFPVLSCSDEQIFKMVDPLSIALRNCASNMDIKRIEVWKSGGRHIISKSFSSPVVMGRYSTQSKLDRHNRHNSRAHVQQLTLFFNNPSML